VRGEALAALIVSMTSPTFDGDPSRGLEDIGQS
jgi:hypothetical protein